MMNKYKVIQLTSAEAFETALNELSQSGWKVKAANMAFPAGAGAAATYFALLESVSVEEELKQMLEEHPDELDNIDLSPSAN